MFICVDDALIYLILYFKDFYKLSNNITILNLISKEINMHSKIFQHNTRSIVINYSSGIFREISSGTPGPCKAGPNLENWGPEPSKPF
jgi:hypothetical protein